MQYPLLEVDRLRPHVKRWLNDNGNNVGALAHQSGVSRDVIQRIVAAKPYVNKKHGTKRFVDFGTADKLITKGIGNPFLWWTELRDVYTKPLSPIDYERELMGFDTEPRLKCCTCKKTKPKEQFFRRLTGRRGRDYRCKLCEKGAKTG